LPRTALITFYRVSHETHFEITLTNNRLEQIERSSNDCDAHGIPFTFDAEAVCGIKLPVSSETISVSVTTSEATTVTKAKASETVTTTDEGSTTATTTGTELSAASQTTSGAEAAVTDNSAPRAKGMLAAAAIALGVFV
jgi:hypothetical protein